MAASSWVDILKSHQLWEKLKSPDYKATSTLKQVLAVQDDVLFLWDFSKEVLLSLNLRSISTYVSQPGGPSKSTLENELTYQTLLLSAPPKFQVSWLIFNVTGSLFAVAGKRGVVVGQTPNRWGRQGIFEGGKDTVSVRTQPIDEHFYVCNQNVEVVQVLWHPGSSADTHLAILSSDNCIRVYNVEKPTTTIQKIGLGLSAGSLLPGTSSTFASCLGETAVSFAFGPPVSQTETKEDARWRVFVLLENGDIYTFLSSLEKNMRPSIVGPLPMQPPADDNYGVDTCSLLCLKSNPPVLAVATSSGQIHHSIVLTDKDSTSQQSESSLSKSSHADPVEPGMSLYVYESVELALNLVTERRMADEADISNVQLYHDPRNSAKYYVAHNAGVHAVLIPFIHQLEDFVAKPDDEHCDLPAERPCIVEHMLCSQPVANECPRPVIGVSFVTSPPLGFYMLVVVDPGLPIVFPLSVYCQPPPEKLLSDSASSPVASVNTPKESLEQHIQEILKRNNMQPFLMAGDDLNPTPQQCLQLLTRATASLREHVLRLDTAREEIERRVKVLKIQKEHQLKELENLKQSRQSMRKHAEALAERYECLQDGQLQISERLEDILLRVERQSPVISDAEKQMQSDLESMQEMVEAFQSAIKELKAQQKYQETSLENQEEKLKKKKNLWGSGLSDNQHRHLYDLIKQEGDDIAELQRKLNDMKLNLGV